MTELSRKIASRYDQGTSSEFISEFYEGSDFLNFGYWTGGVTSTSKACGALVEKLLDFIPEKNGTILDVGCGKGATTQVVLKHFPPEKVTAINISPEHIKICKQKLPQCNFLEMDAASLDFPDDSFNNIICVEASHHFDTRERFLKEAYRVLAPGGYLVVADVLPPKTTRSHPPANWVRNLKEYEELYRGIGFSDINIIDATEECVHGFTEATRRYAQSKRQTRELGLPKFLFLMMKTKDIAKTYSYALLACRKSGRDGAGAPDGASPVQNIDEIGG